MPEGRFLTGIHPSFGANVLTEKCRCVSLKYTEKTQKKTIRENRLLNASGGACPEDGFVYGKGEQKNGKEKVLYDDSYCLCVR